MLLTDSVPTGPHEHVQLGHPELRRPRHRTGNAARTLQTLAIIGGLLLIVWLLSDIVLLIFMAVLIAVMLRGVGDWAARHTGLSQQTMLAVVSIAAAGLILGLLYYIGPKLGAQSEALWTQLHQQLDHLREVYGNTPWGQALFHDYGPRQAVQNHLASYAGVVATSTLGGLASTFIVIVTALYLAISPALYINGVVRLFPPPYRPRARDVLLDIGRTLRWWSLGQLIDMGVVGVLTGIGLALLGVPLPLAFAVLAGLLTFIPYFGAITAAVPAILVAFTLSWHTSLWVLLIFAICHGIEGYVIGPLVQRSTVDLPPALTISIDDNPGCAVRPAGNRPRRACCRRAAGDSSRNLRGRRAG